jgi:hypothetical protein
MGNTRYGGRYTDNFIEDITPPGHQRGLVPVREDVDNFRPFEEVADNFINTSPVRPQARHVAEAQSSYAVPIDDSPTEPRPSGYTYVPPMSALRPTDEILTPSEAEAHANSERPKGRLMAFVTGFIASWIVRPYRTVVNFWDEHVLTRRYSLEEGAGYRFDRDAEDSLVAAGIGALLIVGLLVVSYGLLDNEVKRGNHSGQSGQSAATQGTVLTSTSSGSSASSSKGSGAATAPANPTAIAKPAPAPTTPTSTNTNAVSSADSPTAVLQGGPTLTGGMGGGFTDSTTTPTN